MKDASSYRRGVAAIAIAALSLGGGCACSDHCGRGCPPGGGGYFAAGIPVCFGYSSTCWSAWPSECTSCPTYSYPPAPVEASPKSAPPPAEPIPQLEATPVPEPSPSDERPLREENQSFHQSPPPVLTIDPVQTATFEPLPAVSEPAAGSAIRPSVSGETFAPTEPFSRTPFVPTPAPSLPLLAEQNVQQVEPSVARSIEALPRSGIEEVQASGSEAQVIESQVAVQVPPSMRESTPESEPNEPPAVARRPRFELPALFNTFAAPRKAVSPLPKSSASRTAKSAAPAAPAPEVSTEPVAAPGAFGPPPPVLIAPPTPLEPPAPEIEITHYQPVSPAVAGTPAIILNPSVATSLEHGPPPPVLIDPMFASVPHGEYERPSAESRPAPVIPANHVTTRPSHIIADWEPAGTFQSVSAAAALGPANPSIGTTQAEENLAPIVSPSAVLRRMAPNRSRPAGLR